MPDPFFLFTVDLVTHRWRQGGRGVRVEIVGQKMFDLPTALRRQFPECIVFIGVIAEQVNPSIVEGPLGMACLAAYRILGSGMGRITHEWNFMLLVIALEVKKVFAFFLRHVGRQGLVQTFLKMTILTKNGVSFLRASFLAVHEFHATMAVNADHPLLLVDVRGELVILNTIRPGKWLFGGVRSSVFRIEVMLEATVIIGTDPVPVVTLQALFVAGGGKEYMSGRLAIGKIQMTGRASCAVIDIGIGVAAGVRMAAQAAPAQQVICQLQRIIGRVSNGYLGDPVQCFLGTKGLADQIDLTYQGKMNRLRHP